MENFGKSELALVVKAGASADFATSSVPVVGSTLFSSFYEVRVTATIAIGIKNFLMIYVINVSQI